MKKSISFAHAALGVCLHLALLLYLCAPPFGEAGELAAAGGALLLLAVAVLETAVRLGGSFRRLRCFVRDRLSGCPWLGGLLALYLLCAATNLFYSPLKAQMLSALPRLFEGLALWLGILFYAGTIDKLDNLLMNVTGCGLLLAGAALAGVEFADGRAALGVMAAGLLTGATFLLGAQYQRHFKATVISGLGAVIIPALWQAAARLAPAAQAGSVLLAGRQALMSSAFSLLREYGAAQLLLGRGSGYDLAVTRMAGVHNFLLGDLINGGVLRFGLGLALWLCIGYCVGMLFLSQSQRAFPLIYLCVLGLVFLDALALGGSFLANPLFLLYCALLTAERTMLKKGQLRPRL